MFLGLCLLSLPPCLTFVWFLCLSLCLCPGFSVPPSLLSPFLSLRGSCSVCPAGPVSSAGRLSPTIHSRLRVPGSPALWAGTQVIGGLHRRGCGRWSEPALGPGCPGEARAWLPPREVSASPAWPVRRSRGAGVALGVGCRELRRSPSPSCFFSVAFPSAQVELKGPVLEPEVAWDGVCAACLVCDLGWVL